MLRRLGHSWLCGRLVVICAVIGLAGAAWAAKKEENPTIRSVQGVVSNAQGQAVNGAVVQLKNTKTLQIRSFITIENGAYYFHGLSTDVDYELRADYSGTSSGSRTLSSFDSRKQPVVNLKLEQKK
ncbi:MAG: carboxypeptidase-like regulatory domain-containing protein [Bryobacteraceae bacterium]